MCCTSLAMNLTYVQIPRDEKIWYIPHVTKQRWKVPEDLSLLVWVARTEIGKCSHSSQKPSFEPSSFAEPGDEMSIEKASVYFPEGDKLPSGTTESNIQITLYCEQ